MSRRQTGVDHRYLDWLYSWVGRNNDLNPDHTYTLLAEKLHRIEFRYFVPNDDNRAADGIQLRDDFARYFGNHENLRLLRGGPCSVFEMLVALALRADFITNIENYGADYWFWLMIDNLDLSQFQDSTYMDFFPDDLIEDIVNAWMNREYLPNGQGGLFPLVHTKNDQTTVEIWYQLQEYILENWDF